MSQIGRSLDRLESEIFSLIEGEIKKLNGEIDRISEERELLNQKLAAAEESKIEMTEQQRKRPGMRIGALPGRNSSSPNLLADHTTTTPSSPLSSSTDSNSVQNTTSPSTTPPKDEPARGFQSSFQPAQRGLTPGASFRSKIRSQSVYLTPANGGAISEPGPASYSSGGSWLRVEMVEDQKTEENTAPANPTTLMSTSGDNAATPRKRDLEERKSATVASSPKVDSEAVTPPPSPRTELHDSDEECQIAKKSPGTPIPSPKHSALASGAPAGSKIKALPLKKPLISLTKNNKRLSFFSRGKSKIFDKTQINEQVDDMDKNGGGEVDKQEEQLKELCTLPEEAEGLFDTKRDKIVKEIFTSEASYVQSLYIIGLMKVPKPPAQSPFTEEETRTIFSNIDLIYKFNASLLLDIRERIRTWTPDSTIGDIFLQVCDYFKIYTQYCDNYDNALKCLRSFKSSKVDAYLKQCVADHGQTLQSFLIMPVQRIPRYQLLLRDLKEKTTESHPDFSSLGEAMKKIQEIADRVEKSIAAAESVRKLGSIFTKFVGIEKYVAPHRHFIADGPLKITPTTKSDKPLYDHIILFNDIVLFGRSKGIASGYAKVKGSELPLKLTWMEDMSNSNDPVMVEKCFLLISPDGHYRLEAETAEEKKRWLSLISSALAEETQNSEIRKAKYQFEDGTIYDGEWLDRKFSGHGVIEYPTGAIYEGQWKKGLRDGVGRMTYHTGHVYDGNWKAGTPHGDGVLTDPEGSKYVGQFKNGFKSGQGKLMWNNGDSYVGEWDSNRMNGKGMLMLASGSMYTGEWKMDKRHGIGEFKSSEGYRYEGEWREDLMHGKGKMFYADKSTHDGDWKNDLPDGHGVWESDGGSVRYEGTWVAGRKEGEGKLKEGGALYEGSFKQDRRYGMGKQTEADGRVYEGSWADNRKEGQGTETYPNGACYTGGWHTDKKFGEGAFIDVDGSRYNGGWVKDRREGKATLVYSNGDKYIGDFAKNERWGNGIFESHDGARVYDGQWERNKKHGSGRYTDISLGTYEGQWVNDMRHGPGVFISKSGIKYEGKWKDDQMDGEFMVTYPDTAPVTQNWKDGTLQEPYHKFPPSLPPARNLT